MNKLQSRGADQRHNTISFGDGSELKLVRDIGCIWVTCDYNLECLFTEKLLTKLHYRFGQPGVHEIHEFLNQLRPEDCDSTTRKSPEEITANAKNANFLNRNHMS